MKPEEAPGGSRGAAFSGAERARDDLRNRNCEKETHKPVVEMVMEFSPSFSMTSLEECLSTLDSAFFVGRQRPYE
jgi:hypothetical protein